MSAGREPWLAIEMRQLAALDAIARERSFSAAAEALGYVQSAVSQQIVQLERHLGVRLVDRARGTAAVSLTPAGRVVLQHAEAVRRRYAAAERELAALHDGVRPRLRVGVAPGAAALLGGVDVDVEPVGAVEPVARRLVLDELDAALCDLPVDDDPRLEVVALPADPIVALVPAGAPPARLGRAAAPRDLVGLRLVRLDTWAGQDAALAWLGDATATHTTDREATVRALVAGGEAFALVPSLMAGSGTQVVALRDGPPPRRLGLVWLAGRSDVGAIRTLAAAVLRAADASR